MCFAKPPEPKKAPPPPDRNAATLASVNEMRASAASRAGASDNILTRLSNEEVSGSALKKKLGE